MDILKNSEMKKAMPLFDMYDYNQAVIYSVLENQYDGCVYINDKENIRWALLRTPFLQHFIAGTPVDSCETALEELLFNTILNEQVEKELVVFTVSESWHYILDNIFTKRKGVSDGRKIFAFNNDNYSNINRKPLPDGATSEVSLRKCDPGSHIDTWSARLYISDKEISFCNAIMIGKGMAEIDIGTEEAFRGKGYATYTAILLIDKLVEHSLTPTWSTWPYRVESQHIAHKLGFVSKPDAKAWIWQEGMQ
jgi:hypothetical protein